MYKGITEKRLLKLAASENAVQRDDKGKIHVLFLYDDKSNPSSDPSRWSEYMDKIKLLSAFEI